MNGSEPSRAAFLTLSRLDVAPSGLGGGNVVRLPALGPSGEQNDEPVAVASKVDTVACTEVDPEFQHTLADSFDVGDRAPLNSRQSNGHLGGGDRVQSLEPG